MIGGRSKDVAAVSVACRLVNSELTIFSADEAASPLMIGGCGGLWIGHIWCNQSGFVIDVGVLDRLAPRGPACLSASARPWLLQRRSAKERRAVARRAGGRERRSQTRRHLRLHQAPGYGTQQHPSARKPKAGTLRRSRRGLASSPRL